MQAYRSPFAKIYNLRWSQFSNWVAPYLLEYYEATSAGQSNHPILDLCCGTGHLAKLLLEKGFPIVGIDLSEHMLHYAEENTRAFIDSGQAKFLQSDASDFHLKERFGMVVSTYDALNHLESLEALKRCFACVHAVCDGSFIFDLNTRFGLRRWNCVQTDDGEELFLLRHGMYDDGAEKAWMRFTGFTRESDGRYSRFDETVFNTAFSMEEVRQALLSTGWETVRACRVQDLQTNVPDPEQEERVFFVAVN